MAEAEHHHSTSAAEIIGELEQSRRSLMAAIAGLGEEGFRARHATGEWTAAEVLAHLLLSERRSCARLQATLAEDNPDVAWISDEAVDQEARSAQRLPVPQIVHGLLAQRRDALRLLESLSPEQLARRYRHERRGELTAGRLFRRMAEHEREHAEQIRAQGARATAAAASGWPPASEGSR